MHKAGEVEEETKYICLAIEETGPVDKQYNVSETNYMITETTECKANNITCTTIDKAGINPQQMRMQSMQILKWACQLMRLQSS
jgi:hypothetical protein